MNIRILLFFCFTLLLAGCEETDNTPRTLELPTGSIYNFDSQDQVLKVPVNSNADWQVTGANNWCVPNKTEGYGNDTLTLNITANISSQQRTVTLVVKNRDVRKAIKVTQGAAENEYHYKLPVIFHILYNDATNVEQNVDAAWIYEVLDQVNAFYRNSDKSQDMDVEFIPATQDPNGNPLSEPGIERISWPSSISMDCQKFMNDPNNIPYIWDLNNYVNIMVFTFTNENVLGISRIPYTTGTNGLPGLLNGDRYFVDPTLNHPHCLCINNKFLLTYHQILRVPDAVLTLTHELGHYLGLFHVFIDDTSKDDYCDDTPNYNRSAYDNWLKSLTQQLSFEELAQRTGTDSKVFTSYNIMDYDYSYLDRFTLDQRKRVRHVLENSPLIPGPKVSDGRTRSITSMEIPEARTIQ